MHPFEIEQLEHVAINVRDMDISIAWYQKVLGLKQYKVKKWGEHPVFMLKGKTGVAIFPSNENDTVRGPNSNDVKIDQLLLY